MIELNQNEMLLYTANELALCRDKINKEIERRNGKDINIKKVRAQLYHLARALRCEWIAETYPEDQDTDKLKRRGRKPKPDETTETQAAPQTKPQEALPAGRQATPHVENTPVAEEKRKLWHL